MHLPEPRCSRISIMRAVASTAASVLGLLAGAGCSFDADLAQDESELEIGNGQDLNGQDLNGQDLNGQDLNGQDLNGSELGRFVKWVKYGGAALADGTKLKQVTLDGSQLVGARKHGVPVTGAALVG